MEGDSEMLIVTGDGVGEREVCREGSLGGEGVRLRTSGEGTSGGMTMGKGWGTGGSGVM